MTSAKARCNSISRTPRPWIGLVAITPWATWPRREPETSITPQPMADRPGSRPRMRIESVMPLFVPVPFGLAYSDLMRHQLAGKIQHGEGNFPLPHHHPARAHRQQMLHLGIKMGPRHDRQRRIDAPGLLHDLSRLEGLGDGDEQQYRLLQVCCCLFFVVGCVF